MAEREGFEPPLPEGKPHFECGAFSQALPSLHAENYDTSQTQEKRFTPGYTGVNLIYYFYSVTAIVFPSESVLMSKTSYEPLSLGKILPAMIYPPSSVSWTEYPIFESAPP